MDRMGRITKMTNAAAPLLSIEPDMHGNGRPGYPPSPGVVPPSSQAAGASDGAAAQVIFALLSILSILSPAVPVEAGSREGADNATEEIGYWTRSAFEAGRRSRRYRVSKENRCSDVPSPSQMQCVRPGYAIIVNSLLAFTSAFTSASVFW